MRLFVVSFLVMFTFNFLFSQNFNNSDFNKKDPFLLVKVMEGEDVIEEFCVEKNNFDLFLLFYSLERVDLYTNLNYINQDYPTEFFDFDKDLNYAFVFKSVMEELYKREESTNPKDYLSVVVVHVKKVYFYSPLLVRKTPKASAGGVLFFINYNFS